MRSGADTAGGFFVVGGPVQPDRACYVVREADRRLHSRLAAREYCHVLAPPDAGKTSLMAHTAWRLRGDGCDVATLDLGGIGGHAIAEDAGRWYYSFAWRVVRELRLRVDLAVWWQERSPLTVTQRLRDFFLEVLLASTSRPVVMFLDRLESVAYQPAAGDLFAALRGCVDARATEPEFQRLTFALLGAPGCERRSAWGEDSPFAVSTPVALDDFSVGEIAGLLRGAGFAPARVDTLAGRIRHWTGGQPVLCQKVGRALLQAGELAPVDPAVDERVARLFFGRNARVEDPHLAALGAALNEPASHRAERLTVYGRVCKGARVPIEAANLAHRELIESGVLVDAEGVLQIRNLIYAGVFTPLWVNRSLPLSWRAVAAAAVVVLGLMALPVWYREVLPAPYMRTLAAEREEFVVAREAWSRLRMFPGHAHRADQLFIDYLVRQSRRATRFTEVQRIGERLAGLPGGAARADALLAEFWDRRADVHARRGDRDGALVYALEALSRPSPARRARVGELSGSDLARLLAVARPPVPLLGIEVDPGGPRITTLDENHDITVWRVTPQGFVPDSRLSLADPTAPRVENARRSVLGPGGRRALHWRSAGAGTPGIAVWDVASARVLSRLAQPRDLVAARFVLGGDAVLIAAAGETWLHDAASGRRLGRLPRPGADADAWTLAPGGRFLVSASSGMDPVVWDLRRRIRTGRIPEGTAADALAVAPGGDRLALGGRDARVRILRIRDGRELGVCPLGADAVSVEFDASGRYLATGDAADRLAIWDLGQGTCRYIAGREGNGQWLVRFAPDASAVAIGNLSRGFEHLALPAGTPAATLLQPGMAGEGAAPDDHAAGLWFFTGGRSITYDGRRALKLWDVPTPADTGAGPTAEQRALSASAGVLASGYGDGRVELRMLVPGGGQRQGASHSMPVTRLLFDATGDALASGALDGTLRLHRLSGSAEPGPVMRHEDGAVQDLAFVADGLLLSASTRSVRVWDAGTGTLRRQIDIEAVRPALAVARDGGAVYIAGDRRGLLRWDWSRGEAGALGGADVLLRRVAVSDDGSWLATADAGRVVRLWRPQSGVPMRREFTAAAPVDALQFLPGEGLLVRAGAWVHFLEVDATGLVARLTRSLPDPRAPLSWAPGLGLQVAVAAAGPLPQAIAFGLEKSWAAPAMADPAVSGGIRGRLGLALGPAGEIRPRQ